MNVIIDRGGLSRTCCLRRHWRENGVTGPQKQDVALRTSENNSSRCEGQALATSRLTGSRAQAIPKHVTSRLGVVLCFLNLPITISTTVRNYRRISEAETAKQVLFTCPSEIIFWQLTGSGEDIGDFLGRKLSELESSFLCEQCWDILLGFHEIGLAKRDIPGIFNSPWKWAIFDHLFRHSQVVVLKAARNGHLFR